MGAGRGIRDAEEAVVDDDKVDPAEEEEDESEPATDGAVAAEEATEVTVVVESEEVDRKTNRGVTGLGAPVEGRKRWEEATGTREEEEGAGVKGEGAALGGAAAFERRGRRDMAIAT